MAAGSTTGRVVADGLDYFRNWLFTAILALALPVVQASAASTTFDGELTASAST
jgi:hypothetical protein